MLCGPSHQRENQHILTSIWDTLVVGRTASWHGACWRAVNCRRSAPGLSVTYVDARGSVRALDASDVALRKVHLDADHGVMGGQQLVGARSTVDGLRLAYRSRMSTRGPGEALDASDVVKKGAPGRPRRHGHGACRRAVNCRRSAPGLSVTYVDARGSVRRSTLRTSC